jgi:histidyl-tRNA synthetase
MKPSLPQGTRDFSAATIYKRQFILNTIKDVFELYGFEPLETPAMENLETLMGKYGDEGDKLIFKILNNGLDNPAKKETLIKSFDKVLEGKNEKGITERALRYDLTIPFARYVAMNYAKLTMPFKRYQMQSVWRADRPQKGRYREFMQCDVDVVGSNSLLNEVEFANVYITVFHKLGIDVEIKINNRKILAGIAEAIGAPDKMIDMAIAIDKFEKVGLDGVRKELTEKGFSPNQISDLTDFIFAASNRIAPINVNLKDGEDFILYFLKNAAPKYISNENYKKGIDEVEELLEKTQNSKLKIDLTLSRGLNYYTGIIFEVKAKNVNIGSIGGGGRYDNLTGLFDLPNIPGVGISFGVDRIYDVMNELNLFPSEINKSSTVLFFNLGEKEAEFAFKEMQLLRNKGISCELFYESVKLDKQFKYAAKKNIPFAVIIGSNEMQQRTCIVKDLVKAEQQTIPLENLSSFFN